MIVCARHQAVLEKLGLTSLEQVKNFRGEVIKSHRSGRRDILRIRTTGENGRPLELFLKRNWRAHTKNGLLSLLRHGRVWSLSRQEWENSLSLQNAGLMTAPLVAYGEECGWLCERFSFLITESVAHAQTVQQFLGSCHDPCRRQRVLDALARAIRRMHDAGLAMPDLFTRHIFVEDAAEPPVFHLIDMARLDRRQPMSRARRARDLAALNITASLRDATTRERIRFLHVYDGQADRKLIRALRARMDHLLHRKKFSDFHNAAGNPPRCEFASS